ncbi:MAG: LacI family DNA-binding transcriptional regulator [Candidatus Acidiferrales bacterium]
MAQKKSAKKAGKAPLTGTASRRRDPNPRPASAVSLRQLADHLGLSPATVSVVINRSPVADTISAHTKSVILAAARKFNYRPNFFARSLRMQRSLTIGVLVPEVSDGYATAVLSGIEDDLVRAGYFYFVASHHHRADLIDEYPKLFLDRAVDAIIAVDTPWRHKLRVPTVTVSGHDCASGVINVVLDHELAASLALNHLLGLGHRKIAFIKGQAFSSDTETRWNAILKAAAQLGISVSRGLTVQLEGYDTSPRLGYELTKKLLKSSASPAGEPAATGRSATAGRCPFTALFAFNDISAMGAIRALRESGLRVPEDVSVVGFDDIRSAAYQNPSLTTVRQPLRKMGTIAAETVLRRICDIRPNGRTTGRTPGKSASVSASDSRTMREEIVVAPELIVRETTARARRT